MFSCAWTVWTGIKENIIPVRPVGCTVEAPECIGIGRACYIITSYEYAVKKEIVWNACCKSTTARLKDSANSIGAWNKQAGSIYAKPYHIIGVIGKHTAELLYAPHFSKWTGGWQTERMYEVDW